MEETDMASYSNKRFSMYDGEEETVRMECRNNLAGVFIDRFGKDVKMFPVDEEHFQTSVKVAVSGQFFGWVMAFGTEMKILGPEHVVEQMKDAVEQIRGMY